MNRDPFAAIADPTRRKIMSAIAHEPLTFNQISEQFDIVSRQAVSKQIRFLENSGLLKIHKVGREKYCYLSLEPLSEVNEWVQEMTLFWHKRLDNLDNFLHNQTKKS
jgi:DNA-binding transcriptional ArsR family regulator